MTAKHITVVGAGVLGLWQALTLARAGHHVRLIERNPDPLAGSASMLAGAMLAPDFEGEATPAIVRDLGREAIALWRATYPGLVTAGTLVVAAARSQAELQRFARVTRNHEMVDAARLAALEPALAGRFDLGLFFPDEAHMATPDALSFLLTEAKRAGVDMILGERWVGGGDGVTVDCRGMGARSELPNLRGVRGERLLVASHEVSLARPVRLLHPRRPAYVVPWGDGRFGIGSTVIESEDEGPVTLQSALDLLGSAYALLPTLGEAGIVAMDANLRPSFPDNVPRAIVRDGGRRILVNGAYRHGFLLAPILAEAVVDFIATEEMSHPLLMTEP